MTADIGRELTALKARISRIERASRLGSASLDDTALEVRDDAGGLRGLLGQQADGTTAVNIVNGPPPPAPAAPAVTSVLGGIAVTWNGQLASGAVIPLDWARVEVHTSITAGFTPDVTTLKATFETPQGGTVVIAAASAQYVVLLARNTSGAASPASAQAGPAGPSPVVASDILDGIVTTVKLADDAVTAAKVATGAIGTTEIADDAVTTPKLIANSVVAGKIAADAVQAGTIAADAVTAREIAALAVTAAELAANSVIAGKIAAGAVQATSLTIGIAQSIAEKLNDAMGDSSMWSQVAGAGTPAWLTGVTDASAGSTVFQATGQCTMERQVNIPYDPDTLYRVTVRVRVLTAPTSGGAISLGITGIAADGTTRVSISGANTVTNQHFIAASSVTIAPGTAWTTYTGYIKGTAATGTLNSAPDPKVPGAAQTLVRYIRPQVRLLNTSTDGVAQVDQVTVETVPTGLVNSVNIADGAITTPKLVAGSVDATALSATAITGKTITGGTVTGAVVQTSVSGARAVMDNSDGSIKVYDASGNIVDYFGGPTNIVYNQAGFPNGEYVGFWLGNLILGVGSASAGPSGYGSLGVIGSGTAMAAQSPVFGTLSDPVFLIFRSGDPAKTTGDAARRHIELDGDLWISGAMTKAVQNGGIWTQETWHAPTMGTGWATGPVSGSYPPLKYRQDSQGNVHVFGTFHATSATPNATIATGFPAVNQTVLGGVAPAGAAVKIASPAASISLYLNNTQDLRSAFLPTIAVNDAFMINAVVPMGLFA